MNNIVLIKQVHLYRRMHACTHTHAASVSRACWVQGNPCLQAATVLITPDEDTVCIGLSGLGCLDPMSRHLKENCFYFTVLRFEALLISQPLQFFSISLLAEFLSQS